MSTEAILIVLRLFIDQTIVGNVMRELTQAEIEQFDFTGQIPDLHLPSQGTRKTVSITASSPQRINTPVKHRPKKRRFQLGGARTA